MLLHALDWSNLITESFSVVSAALNLASLCRRACLSGEESTPSALLKCIWVLFLTWQCTPVTRTCLVQESRSYRTRTQSCICSCATVQMSLISFPDACPLQSAIAFTVIGWAYTLLKKKTASVIQSWLAHIFLELRACIAPDL